MSFRGRGTNTNTSRDMGGHLGTRDDPPRDTDIPKNGESTFGPHDIDDPDSVGNGQL